MPYSHAVRGIRNRLTRVTLLAFAICCLVGAAFAGIAGADDWPTFLHDPARSSASTETSISPSNAGSLAKAWAFKTGGGVAASPTVVNGVVYVGSWDGYEYALDAATGALKWKTFLGRTSYGTTNCPYPTDLGVSSAAAVNNGVVYVGGGDSYWYALSANTGSVLWRIYTGDNSASGGHYNWSSPLIYNGSAYIGIASLDDCPLVQGQLLRVSLSSHKVVASWNAVPTGQVGGGIWTSPTVDAATNTVYVTTGTQTASSQQYAQALVSLDATTLAPNGSWQVPAAQQVTDGDWGTTPNLLPGGLVAAANKNGVMYAFPRSNISGGPVWQQRVANGGACPTCGDGTVASGALGGGKFYVSGGNTSIGGTNFNGSVSAFDPTTGNVLWRQGLQGPVIPSVSYVNGLVLAGSGSNFVVLDAGSGKVLLSYSTGGAIYSAPSVSGGRIYIGSQDGNVYAFAPGSSPPPANTVRVNAGGGNYTDSAGNNWSADCCNSGGNTYSTTASIAGTSDPPLYQSERWNTGPFTYTFTGLAAGTYHVTLKFAEIAYLGPGQRQFNVAINGTPVLTNFDVAAQVGFNNALDKTFTTTTSNGQITIAFTQGAANYPIVSAIQIGPVSAGAPSQNVAPPAISGTPVQHGTLTAALGSWAGSPAPGLSPEWMRCNARGTTCGAIARANGLSYRLSAADVGSTIRLRVGAVNPSGSAQAESAATGVVKPNPAGSLTGVARRSADLRLTGIAVTAALKRIQITLPRGLRFPERLRRLRAGIRVTDQRGKRVAFTVALRHGVLTLTLARSVGAAHLTIGPESLAVSAQLASSVRRRRTRKLTVTVSFGLTGGARVNYALRLGVS